MPPKKNSEAGAAVAGYTESDMKLMVALIEMMERTSIDYDVLAEKIGSASTNAARTRVHTAVNKHPTWFTGAGAATNEDGSPVKKAHAKRGPKKKAPSDEDDENVEEEQAKPAKKKARTRKTKVSEDVKEDADAVEGQI